MTPAVLAFDPSDDGRLVAGDCLGASLAVWNWRTGGARTLSTRRDVETRIPRGGAPACLLAVSPDGTRAAQAHGTGSASLWDLTGGRRLGPDLAPGQSVRDLAWSPDSERLAVAAGKVATVLDRSGGEVSATPSQVDFVTSVAFDPEADLMVTSSRDGVARVWDVSTGGPLAELRGHTDEIADAAFNGDGRVVTLSLDGTVRSWQVVEGRVIRHADWVLDAVFSPDGERVATAAADGGARVTELGGGAPVAIRGLAVDLQTANSIAFDPDGQRVVVAGGHDAQYGQIVVADAATGEVRQELLPAGQVVTTAAFSPDGEWLVTTAVEEPPALWRLSESALTGDSEPDRDARHPQRPVGRAGGVQPGRPVDRDGRQRRRRPRLRR